MADVGALLTGIGSTALAVVAWLELPRWRERQRRERGADAAAEVLSACLQLLEAMRYLTSMASLEGDVPEGHTEPERYEQQILQTHRARMANIETDLKRYEGALGRAYAYLDEDRIKAVEAVREKLQNIRASIEEFAMYVGADQGAGRVLYNRERERAFRGALGPDVQKEIAELRQRVLEALRPVARLET